MKHVQCYWLYEIKICMHYKYIRPYICQYMPTSQRLAKDGHQGPVSRNTHTLYLTLVGWLVDWLVGWLVVFHVPSTALSFRDGIPFTVPCEGWAVAWKSITLPLSHASSYIWRKWWKDTSITCSWCFQFATFINSQLN